MNRTLLLMLTLIVSPNIYAKDLCPVSEEIAEDMRIPESYFNKKNATRSMGYLNSVVVDDAKSGEWFSLPNSLKVIKGYVHRRNALHKTNEGSLEEFCAFMKTEAFWYD